MRPTQERRTHMMKLSCCSSVDERSFGVWLGWLACGAACLIEIDAWFCGADQAPSSTVDGVVRAVDSVVSSWRISGWLFAATLIQHDHPCTSCVSRRSHSNRQGFALHFVLSLWRERSASQLRSGSKLSTASVDQKQNRPCLDQREGHVRRVAIVHQPDRQASAWLEAGRRGREMGREGGRRSSQEAEEEQTDAGGVGEGPVPSRTALEVCNDSQISGWKTAGLA